MVKTIKCLGLDTITRLFIFIGAKTSRLIDYKSKITYLRDKSILVCAQNNTCSFYDLRNIEGEFDKCIKLSRIYTRFQSKIFFYVFN